MNRCLSHRALSCLDKLFRVNILYRRGFVAVVFGVLLTQAVNAADAVSTSNASKKDRNAIAVVARPVSDVAFYPKRRAPAKTMSIDNSQISAEITAPVVRVPVHVGDVVKRGAVVAELDCADYKLQLAMEEAQQESLSAKIDLAKYQLQRAQALLKKQAVSDELLRQRETELRVLKAQSSGQSIMVKQAKRNIDKCLVRTPFKAVVIKKLAQVGELANPGTPIVQIIDAMRIEVSADVQSHLISQLTNTSQVHFLSAGKEYPVTLVSVTPVVDTRERTQEVRMQFKKEKPLPGSAGEIIWSSSLSHLPAEYLVKRNGQVGLFFSDNGTAKFIEVAGAIIGRSAAVNIDGKRLLVTKGRFQLQDGDKIVIR